MDRFSSSAPKVFICNLLWSPNLRIFCQRTERELRPLGCPHHISPKKFHPNTPDFLDALHDRGVDNVMKHMFVAEPLQIEKQVKLPRLRKGMWALRVTLLNRIPIFERYVTRFVS